MVKVEYDILFRGDYRGTHVRIFRDALTALKLFVAWNGFASWRYVITNVEVVTELPPGYFGELGMYHNLDPSQDNN